MLVTVLTFPVSAAATAPPLDPRTALAAWSSTSAPLALTWDVAHKGPASEPTAVHVTTDGTFLYLRFDATQRAAVVATQHSNDLMTGGSVGTNGNIIWSNDDAVWVDLWPTGPGGFEYQFEANADGAHNESSSENVAFAPQWESHGAISAGGYTVTMAIPFAAIHGAHAGTWRAQFVRYVRANGALNVWAYIPAQTQPDDAEHAGALVMPKASTHAPPPKPRLAVYALGAVASAPAGGNTSRVGADLSFPVTPTASFYATFHPDYSNVELDQQTIAPSLSARAYAETRPFFTQAASYYNNFPCAVCPAQRQTLYTPAIPTPSQGYAFEGKQGAFGFAGFDAIGDARNDSAAVLNYTSDDNHWQASMQHVQADLPGVVDDANQAGVNWRDGKYLSANIDYSTDAGTNVLVPSQGSASEGGVNWISQDLVVSASLRKVGAYFNPVDGFNAHPDIAGYGLYAARLWQFAPQDKLQSIALNGMLDRYQGAAYGQSQSDNWLDFDVLTKSAWDVQIFTGSDYWRFGPVLEPVSQSAGFRLSYHSASVNNLQYYLAPGPSANPTQIWLFRGHYGNGFLDAWFRNSAIRVGNRGTLNVTLDSTQQYMRSGPDNVQWFEGLAYAYQIGPSSSLAIGVRRVIGYPPIPNGGGNCEGTCSNVSIAYHVRWRREELYVAYGDPNALIAVPQAIFKLIFYAGAEKGV
ncbi:MAG: hypothetical protein WBD74_15090 [Candidatus Aquilonibacter sp.]